MYISGQIPMSHIPKVIFLKSIFFLYQLVICDTVLLKGTQCYWIKKQLFTITLEVFAIIDFIMISMFWCYVCCTVTLMEHYWMEHCVLSFQVILTEHYWMEHYWVEHYWMEHYWVEHYWVEHYSDHISSRFINGYWSCPLTYFAFNLFLYKYKYVKCMVA